MKGRESNRVCRKDEEGARGGRGSINKSIGGDEETSR